MTRPLIISAPAPRTLPLVFRDEALARLKEKYEIVETDAEGLPDLDDRTLAAARFLIGQPPLPGALVARMTGLRAVFNVEGNFTPDMDYEALFSRGVHVVTPSQVFARPVAEIGMGMALDLFRQITASDRAFAEGSEAWGLDSNRQARLLHRAEVGMIGYGEIGRVLHGLLKPFDVTLKVFDPWLPDATIRDAGAHPVSFESAISETDLIFVVAGVTSENRGFIDADAFASMRHGAAFVLLSRADVVDFDAFLSAVGSGRITGASDVWPEEPLRPDHPARGMTGLLRSAHRAGAMEHVFHEMGDYVLDDMDLLDRGLPPMRCRRAERETVGRLRSRPVDKS